MRFLGWMGALSVLLWCPEAHGAEAFSEVARQIQTVRQPGQERQQLQALFPQRVQESESLWDFFKQRTHWGVGLDEVYNDNVFLQDNDAREDYITTLKGQVAFFDPRGTILYGATHKINAFRYHHKDQNAIDHDFRAFVNVDPGGRTQAHLDYKLSTSNSLLLGPVGIDLLRRNSGFQRSVDHAFKGSLRYSLNPTNNLTAQIRRTLYDDQSLSDADTDRRLTEATLDVDHDLRPGWMVYGGAGWIEATLPANTRKSSESQTLRLGTQYEVSEISYLDLLLQFEHRRWKSDQQKTNLSIHGSWAHSLGPRLTLLLGYKDERIPSYTAGRLQFRTTRPSLQLLYELTPLATLSVKAEYEKQRSGGRDVLTGESATTAVSSRYDFGAQWKRRVGEKGEIMLDYGFTRSKTGDYTNQVWLLGFKKEL